MHRTELTVLERAEHIAEWVRLTEAKGVSAQVAPKLSARGRSGEGRPKGGINAAVRELSSIGINRTEAQRAMKITTITDEAKEAARAAGLGNNQSALLEIARAAPDQQATKVDEVAAARQRRKVTPPAHADDVTTDQVNALMAAWNRAGPEAARKVWETMAALARPAGA